MIGVVLGIGLRLSSCLLGDSEYAIQRLFAYGGNCEPFASTTVGFRPITEHVVIADGNAKVERGGVNRNFAYVCLIEIPDSNDACLLHRRGNRLNNTAVASSASRRAFVDYFTGFFIEYSNFALHSNEVSRRLTNVLNRRTYNQVSLPKLIPAIDYRDIGANLSLPYLPRFIDGRPRRFVGLSRQPKRVNQSSGSDGNQNSLPHCQLGHTARCRVHTLLGQKVFLLPLSGFLLAAFAGIGGFWLFDDPNGNRKRLGAFLLFVGGPLGLVLIFLGLP